MEETKNALRRIARSRRGALSHEAWLDQSCSIQAKVVELSQYLTAESVVLYSPVNNEVETRLILDHALRHGKKVFYPKLTDEKLPMFARILAQEDLISGRYGLPEPAGTIPLTASECERLTVIVPGLMFDRRGRRLGRGGGWYDRALHWIGIQSFVVGLAFEFQVVDRLPEQSWDQRVHCITTELRVIGCSDITQPEVIR